MQELAKQFINSMYTEAQLISFGNSLLSTYDVTFFSTDGKNIPLLKREVSHADMENWKENQQEHVQQLPSAFQIGDFAKIKTGEDFIVKKAQVLNVHFSESKVRYDLSIFFNVDDAPYQTRIYNVDSAMLNRL